MENERRVVGRIDRPYRPYHLPLFSPPAFTQGGFRLPHHREAADTTRTVIHAHSLAPAFRVARRALSPTPFAAKAEWSGAPPQQACASDPQRADRDSAIRERIAHTANGDIVYYRFGSGSPIVLQTGLRATLSGALPVVAGIDVGASHVPGADGR